MDAKGMLYLICKYYVDIYRGENNCNIHKNGELRFMRHELVNCKVVFDVGANIGDWAALALEINPRIILHCFEPSQVTYKRLLSRDFGKSNIILNNFGFSSTSGKRTLYVFEDSSGLNSLYQRRGLEDGSGLNPQQQKETIVLETIDNYCKANNICNIDFMKVDVEGHEFDVFNGATRMLENNRIKTIQFEYGGCCIDAKVLLKDIFEYLIGYRYKLFKVYPDRLKYFKQYDQRLENFQYQNWIAKISD